MIGADYNKGGEGHRRLNEDGKKMNYQRKWNKRCGN